MMIVGGKSLSTYSLIIMIDFDTEKKKVGINIVKTQS